MKKTKIKYQMEVLAKEYPSPGILRVVASYHNCPKMNKEFLGGYIKLCLKDQGGEDIVRTYSIAEVNEKDQTFSVDFVDHRGTGPGAIWARDVSIKDTIMFYGPGQIKNIDESCEEFYFLGDMTAFAAMKSQLQIVLESFLTKKVVAIFEIEDMKSLEYFTDQLKSEKVHYDVNTDVTNKSGLLKKFQKIDLSSFHKKSIWCAGERLSINTIRKYLSDNLQVSFHHKYISSYWQRGLKQDEHVMMKKQDKSL